MAGTAAEPIRDYSRLTREEIALIRQLSKAGKTQPEIAQIIGCSQPTVCKWLAAIEDPVDEAKHLCRNAAPEFAKRVIKGKSEQVALEMLDRLRVTDRPVAGSREGAGVTVIIGVQAEQVNFGGESQLTHSSVTVLDRVSLSDSTT